MDLIPKILSIQPTTSKILYFSDGCKAQYKSKYSFINIYHHFEDFGVKAEWNFWATSHGKNATDGIGGTTKRGAHQEMMKGHVFTNAITIVNHLNQLQLKTKIVYLDAKSIEKTRRHLKKRYSSALPIEGTMSFHQVSEGYETKYLCFKDFSLSADIKSVQIMK